MQTDVITPELLINAYANGLFPMSEGREDDDLFWVSPELRGIIPLLQFHLPKSLAKAIRQEKFKITTDHAFRQVVRSCAKPARGRETTWISERIEDLYTHLHELGYAHSVECWQDDKLVGGLYGVALRGAFFGESMFSLATNASKVALAALVARLKAGGYSLLDTQFITDHLKKFGAVEIEKTEYMRLLNLALLQENADFSYLDASISGAELVHFITHTS